ncbi:MAG: serine protease [Bdellovibrio sp.]
MKVMNHLLCAGMILAAASTGFAKSHNEVGANIVGGVEAAVGEFPFIVSLQSSSHFCGGSLIAKNWVLTAAHCVRGGTVRKILVGLHNQKDAAGAETLKPKRIIAHPQYNSSNIDYDFALIELDGESTREPVLLNTADINPAENETIMSTVAGWGTLREGSYGLPSILQKVDVPVVSQESCNQAYKNEITDRMICAGFAEGKKDSCQGDSGGPLIAQAEDGQRYLIGVVSWGEGCARAGRPGVYSRVSSVIPWIEQTIR